MSIKQDIMQEVIKDLQSHTDLWPWYWLSYGEKCYAFATVEAFPLNETDPFPEPGSQLISEYDENNKTFRWVGENGVTMCINNHIATIERQNGDTICKFIAIAHAYFLDAFNLSADAQDPLSENGDF